MARSQVSGHEFTHAVQRSKRKTPLLPQARREAQRSDIKEAAAKRSDKNEAGAFFFADAKTSPTNHAQFFTTLYRRTDNSRTTYGLIQS
jgi:cyclophilin family peptidyl-prolyl cis-trans isomerase